MLTKSIVSTKEARFVSEVVLNGPVDTGVQEFSLPGSVKESVEVSGIARHADIAPRCRLPLNHGQETSRVVIENGPVFVYPVQDRGRYRKYHARWIEATLSKNMVYQVSVDAAVVVLKGVDVDETEGEYGSGNDGIEFWGGLSVKGHHAAHERPKVLRSCADVIRQRRAADAIVRANEPLFRPEA